MKRMQVLLALFALVLGAAGASATPESPSTILPRELYGTIPYTAPCSGEQLRFNVGERFEFKGKVLLFKVMECAVEVVGTVDRDGTPCYHLRGTAETTGMGDLFQESFMVLDTYVDRETHQLVANHFLLHTNKVIVESERTYDQDGCIFTYTNTKVDAKTGEVDVASGEAPYESGAPDFLLFLYRMASIECPPGSQVPFTFFGEDRAEYFDVAVHEPDAVRSELGREQARHFTIEEDSHYYFSKDGKRKLLRAKFKNGLQTLNLILTGYSPGAAS